ncbi:hypothetical protein MF672_024275 [Actinomadura sp. ATCC 31491]|uniref:Uncharacterized protein n=1 Tax=Actinomadura luzonensis TaxID=2805427 RepID=A0ABT0FY67_9ACTN|nr:hypothetical protein [Actinomadura luzonensis]MCK2216885.1 hypothetical protein [Actinomadura luzonensis]
MPFPLPLFAAGPASFPGWSLPLAACSGGRRVWPGGVPCGFPPGRPAGVVRAACGLALLTGAAARDVRAAAGTA